MPLLCKVFQVQLFLHVSANVLRHILVMLSDKPDKPDVFEIPTSQRGQCTLGMDGEELCRDDLVPFLVATFRGAEVWVFGLGGGLEL